MNLYKFHSDPESLEHHDEAHQMVPKLIVDHIGIFPKDLSPAQIRAISKDPEYAYRYAYFRLGRQRWPEAEQHIMKDPEYARIYAQRIIKGRWPEAEPYIFKDEEAAIDYILHVSRQPVKQFEHLFLKDPNDAAGYAIDCLKSRWVEAEKIIKQDREAWEVYSEHFNL